MHDEEEKEFDLVSTEKLFYLYEINEGHKTKHIFYYPTIKSQIFFFYIYDKSFFFCT